MTANELRIGNWIKSNLSGNEFQFTSYHFNDLNIILTSNPPKPLIEPIPLTDEWLLKFGFEKFNGRFWPEYNLNEFVIYTSHKEKYSFIWNTFTKDIISVHSLQNLYFALTGSELEIK